MTALLTTQPECTPAPSADDGFCFEPISGAECHALLRTHSMGRVGWMSADGPDLLPVTYHYTGDHVVFRTSRSGVLAGLATPQPVVFGIDDLHEATRTGWTVRARGRSGVAGADLDPEAFWALDRVRPWAPGPRDLYLAIQLESVTGRVISA